MLMVCVQKVASVGDMLATMKLICLRLSPDDVQQIDSLRFNVILRMLKSEHFNARMNALKEVGSAYKFRDMHFVFSDSLNILFMKNYSSVTLLQKKCITFIIMD